MQQNPHQKQKDVINSMYLPDSNIIIRAFKGYEPEASFIRRNIIDRSIKISVIVIAEFLVKANDEQAKRFNSVLEEFGSLPIDERIARAAGEYRKQFLRKTTRTFLLDCYLAAQAKLHNLTIVTNNRKDFPMKDINIISLSDNLVTKTRKKNQQN